MPNWFSGLVINGYLAPTIRHITLKKKFLWLFPGIVEPDIAHRNIFFDYLATAVEYYCILLYFIPLLDTFTIICYLYRIFYVTDNIFISNFIFVVHNKKKLAAIQWETWVTMPRSLWIVYRLKNTYYYKAAYIDLVRTS